jgi:hypothetical protein
VHDDTVCPSNTTKRRSPALPPPPPVVCDLSPSQLAGTRSLCFFFLAARCTAAVSHRIEFYYRRTTPLNRSSCGSINCSNSNNHNQLHRGRGGMSSVTHDLHQYRYVTSVHHSLPWTHVRHVSIPGLRNESPDLPLMANLIAGLADCDISLKEVREHTDADILQLCEVLQACLQFALWSQNILKEKLLEMQSSQVARRVTARQLDAVESRCRALEKDVAALASERDTLSLGTASLRTSLVQLETTVKMQARQLQQERERTSLLLSKLEKALEERERPRDDAPWRPDGKESSRCPTGGHRRHHGSSHQHRHAPDAASGQAHPLRSSQDALSDTATSYTDDSLMEAEGQWLCEESRRHRGLRRCRVRSGGEWEGVFPAPCLDWRTLVRYIIHEEKQIPVWPTSAASAAAASAPAGAVGAADSTTTATAATTTAAPASSSPPPTVSGLALRPDMTEELYSLVSDFTTAVTGEVGDYARGTAAETRELMSTLTQQRVRELTDAQRTFVRDVVALLRAVFPPPPPPLPSASAAVGAVSSSPAAQMSDREGAAHFMAPLRDLPVTAGLPPASPAPLSLSPVVKSIDMARKTNVKASVTEFVLPQSSTSEVPASKKSGERYDYGSLYPSRDSGNSSHRASHPPSFFNSPVQETHSHSVDPRQPPQQQRDSHLSISKRSSAGNSRTSLLPIFSPDILRTPCASPHHTSSSSSKTMHSTPDKTSAHTTMAPPNELDLHCVEDEEEEEDGQPPDADFRLPTSTTTSHENSYQSSSGGGGSRHRSDSSGDGGHASIFAATVATTVATAVPTSASVANVSAHSPPSAKPITTPPVYPALTSQQSGSPLTSSPSPAGFSLYRAVSLPSSMRSDASGGGGGGGSTHASSQMLRDTQRELEALLAEDEAAERAKKQK